MLAFSALVAGSFSLGAQVANELSPTALNAIRFVIAALAVGIVLSQSGRITSADFAAPWRFVVLGGFFGIYFVLMFEGLKTAQAVSAATVFALVPIMSAGFAWVLLRQVTTARMAGALLIGGAGAIWVIFRGDPAAVIAFDVGRGELIYFVGCVSHAIYIPLVRLLNRGEGPLVFTFGTLVSCATLIALFAIPDLFRTDWSSLRPMVWITIGYTAVFATALTIFLVQIAALSLPSAKVMAYTYLTPSWVILWEIALGNPAPAGTILVGVALTIVALLLLLRDEGQSAG